MSLTQPCRSCRPVSSGLDDVEDLQITGGELIHALGLELLADLLLVDADPDQVHP
jgi:hypothetical protein